LLIELFTKVILLVMKKYTNHHRHKQPKPNTSSLQTSGSGPNSETS